jgi:hypothetical protein
LVETALAVSGRIDVCVNNAGVASAGPERQAELDTFSAVMRVNVEAVFALTQAVAEHMLAAGSGAIVNVSSMFGLVAATPVPDAPYVASKTALNGLTRELANQWAGKGVRVNAIAPGWFSTEMNSELIDDERGARWLARQCPMGRPGREHELDGVLLFLASDASSYCTGQVIAVEAERDHELGQWLAMASRVPIGQLRVVLGAEAMEEVVALASGVPRDEVRLELGHTAARRARELLLAPDRGEPEVRGEQPEHAFGLGSVETLEVLEQHGTVDPAREQLRPV